MPVKSIYKTFCSLFAIIFISLLSGCSYNQKVAYLNEPIDLSSLEEAKKAGDYTVTLKKNGEMAGTAVIVGLVCSAHKYPYDFESSFDEVISAISYKAYENVTIQDQDHKPQDNHEIMLDMQAPFVSIMCYQQGIMGYCIATTKLNGTAHLVNENSETIEFKINGTNSVSYNAGLACEGGSKAISSSLGNTLNDFGRNLHSVLISN